MANTWMDRSVPAGDDRIARALKRESFVESAREQLPESEIGRQIGVPITQFVGDIAAPVATALSPIDPTGTLQSFSEDFHMLDEAVGQAQAERDLETATPDILERGFRGAARTLPTVVTFSKAGGFKGLVGGIGAQVAEQEYRRALDLGASQKDAVQFAGEQAAIEMVTTTAFQSVAPGLEGMFLKTLRKPAFTKPTLSGLKKGIISGSKNLGAELTEEEIIEIASLVNSKLSGIDPNISGKDLEETVMDTAVTTMITMGLAKTPETAERVGRGLGRKRRLDLIKEQRQAKEQIQEPSPAETLTAPSPAPETQETAPVEPESTQPTDSAQPTKAAETAPEAATEAQATDAIEAESAQETGQAEGIERPEETFADYSTEVEGEPGWLALDEGKKGATVTDETGEHPVEYYNPETNQASYFDEEGSEVVVGLQAEPEASPSQPVSARNQPVTETATEPEVAPPATKQPSLEKPAEQTPAARPSESAKPKQPWEMSYSEIREAISPSTKEGLEAARPILANLYREELQSDADPWGIVRAVERGDEFPRVPTVELSRKHKRAIQEAIEAGETIPPEVLAEYKDLAPESAKPKKQPKGFKAKKPKPADAIEPESTQETAAPESIERKPFKFSKSSGTPKPRYGSQELEFDSDYDKLAYILSKEGRAQKSTPKLIADARRQGHDIEEMRRHGREVVRPAIKSMGDTKSTESLTIPRQPSTPMADATRRAQEKTDARQDEESVSQVTEQAAEEKAEGEEAQVTPAKVLKKAVRFSPDTKLPDDVKQKRVTVRGKEFIEVPKSQVSKIPGYTETASESAAPSEVTDSGIDRTSKKEVDSLHRKVRKTSMLKTPPKPDVQPKPSEGKPKRPADIIKTWSRIFRVPMRIGGFSQRAAAIYKWLPGVIRTNQEHVGNIVVAIHEVAHHLDNKYGISKSIPSDVKQEVVDLDQQSSTPDVEEGWAVYMTHYVTSKDAADLAPGFTQWFENVWMADNPEVSHQIHQAREMSQEYLEQSDFQKIMAQIGDVGRDVSMVERLKEERRRISRRLYGSFIDDSWILKHIEDIARKLGHKGVGVSAVNMLHKMNDGNQAAKAYENGMHSVHTNKKIGEHGLYSLGEFVENHQEYNEAVAYAYARHTVYMADVKPGYNTGMNPERAQRFLDDINRNPDKAKRYTGFAVRISEIRNDSLEMLVDAGAMPADDRDRILKYYGTYSFPLHRPKEKGWFRGGGGGRMVNLPPAVRGRSDKGSGEGIIDPIDAMMVDIRQQYARAGKARIIRALLGTVDPEFGGVGGLGGFMDRIDPKSRKVQVRMEDTLDQLVEQEAIDAEEAKAMKIAAAILRGDDISNQRRQWFADRHGMDVEDDLTAAAQSEPDISGMLSVWQTDYTPNAEKATVMVLDENGNKMMYELDRYLYDVATGMTSDQSVWFERILRFAGRPFRAGAVTLSSGFGVKNLVRDFEEYQGRAVHARGTDSVSEPIRALAAFIKYKVAKKYKKAVFNEDIEHGLIDLFEELGGALYSPIGFDIDSVSAARKRALGIKNKGRTMLPKLGNTVASSTKALQNIIAISDAPPRMSEARAYLRSRGYTYGKDGLRNPDGTKADEIPEDVVVGVAQAIAEATTNFKRGGSISRKIDLVMPFFNATLQAHYRQAVQLRAVERTLLSSKKVSAEDKRQATRTLIYYAALAASGVAYALGRQDDEDYKEQKPHERDGYWSGGKDGATTWQIPKPRDAGIISNFAEALVNKMVENDVAGGADDPLETLRRDMLQRLPGGGGVLKGIYDVQVNEDWRGMPIEPSWLKSKPKGLRTGPYTTNTSDFIGYYTGRYGGLSPLQFEYMANQFFPGYGRIVASSEAAIGSAARALHAPEHMQAIGKREATGFDIPVVGPAAKSFYSGRYRAGSIQDFYRRFEEVGIEMGYNEEAGTVDKELDQEAAKLQSAFKLMGAIRKAEPRSRGGQRTFEYEPYLNSIAREALGRPQLSSAPDPFMVEDPPEPMKVALTDYATSIAKVGKALHGQPKKATDDKTLDERLMEYEHDVAKAKEWLERHKDSKIVTAVLKDTKKPSIGKMPKFEPSKEKLSEHKLDMKLWRQKRSLR